MSRPTEEQSRTTDKNLKAGPDPEPPSRKQLLAHSSGIWTGDRTTRYEAGTAAGASASPQRSGVVTRLAQPEATRDLAQPQSGHPVGEGRP